MRIRILGCSGGACHDLRTTALLVDDDILLDCGTGVGDLTLQEMARIRHVFLTHAHLDHVLFLPLLADAALALREGPLTVHALPETIAALQTHLLNGILWPDYSALPTPDAPYIRFRPLLIGETCRVEHRHITALPALHSIPAAGYLIESDGASFAFSGDTADCAAFWDALNKTEHLKYIMIETTMRNADQTVADRACHTTPATLARGLQRLHRPAQVLITHIEPDKVETIRQQVEAVAGGFRPHFVRRGEVFTL